MLRIRKLLSTLVLDNHVPSVQYFFFTGNTILYNFNLGYADIKARQYVDENTTYNLYSLTKTFTALAVIKLAGEGKINIDSPLEQYMSVFPYTGEITARQLMAHTAGLPNLTSLGWIHLEKEHNNFNQESFITHALQKNRQTLSMPNERYACSNIGYLLLGQLIEKLSGMSYEQYVMNKIIIPLGIKPKDMGFDIGNSMHHATGYHNRFSLSGLMLSMMLNKSKYICYSEGSWKAFKKIYANGAAYGGGIATSGALVKYIQGLLKNDNNLIPERYKELLFTEHRTNIKRPTGTGLSWSTGKLDGEPYVTHAGTGVGYYCEARLYPRSGYGSIIMLNRSGFTNIRMLDKFDNALGRLYVTNLMTVSNN